ncbi:hypothetical protein SAMN05192571_11633 [Pleomorphomonas diazotrophica]|nr:hypothetical protein SAMN05192571_11633 [Pleomorphomonas diazotrophica]
MTIIGIISVTAVFSLGFLFGVAVGAHRKETR